MASSLVWRWPLGLDSPASIISAAAARGLRVRPHPGGRAEPAYAGGNPRAAPGNRRCSRPLEFSRGEFGPNRRPDRTDPLDIAAADWSAVSSTGRGKPFVSKVVHGRAALSAVRGIESWIHGGAAELSRGGGTRPPS